MVIGNTLSAVNTQSGHRIQSPSDWVTAWHTILDAAALDDADNSGDPILNPGAMDDEDHHPMIVRAGTYILLRMRYDFDTTSLTTPPVIQLFGRYPKLGSGAATPAFDWSRLYNIAATPTNEITLTPDFTNDINDGTDAYTSVDIKTGVYVVDRAACHSVLAVVKTAAAGITGGALANITLQAAVI